MIFNSPIIDIVLPNALCTYPIMYYYISQMIIGITQVNVGGMVIPVIIRGVTDSCLVVSYLELHSQPTAD